MNRTGGNHCPLGTYSSQVLHSKHQRMLGLIQAEKGFNKRILANPETERENGGGQGLEAWRMARHCLMV